jgi:hypothetical protein
MTQVHTLRPAPPGNVMPCPYEFKPSKPGDGSAPAISA